MHAILARAIASNTCTGWGDCRMFEFRSVPAPRLLDSSTLSHLISEPSILRMLPASAPDSNVVDPGPRKRRGATALQACDRCRNKARAGRVLSADNRK